jgi:hypothetical protein
VASSRRQAERRCVDLHQRVFIIVLTVVRVYASTDRTDLSSDTREGLQKQRFGVDCCFSGTERRLLGSIWAVPKRQKAKGPIAAPTR